MSLTLTWTFGAGAFAWNKPVLPPGLVVVKFTIAAVGPGGGGSGGTITQGSISGDPGCPAIAGGSGGGYCLYTPNFALVPAVVNGVVGAGGVGGLPVSQVGNIVGNNKPPLHGADGSAATNIGAGVIVCNPGVNSNAGADPGGTAACSLAWGGAAVTQQGGSSGPPNQLIPGNPPTVAAQQTNANGAGNSVPTPFAAGGGSTGYFNNGGAGLGQLIACYGGAPNGGVSGNAPLASPFITGLGPGLPGQVLLNSNNASVPGEGGPAGPSLTVSPTTSPAGNVSVWQAGNGGAGMPGAGGGQGGSVAMTSFPNPGTMTSGAGGAGGDGFAIFTLTVAQALSGIIPLAIFPLMVMVNHSRPISLTGRYKA